MDEKGDGSVGLGDCLPKVERGGEKLPPFWRGVYESMEYLGDQLELGPFLGGRVLVVGPGLVFAEAPLLLEGLGTKELGLKPGIDRVVLVEQQDLCEVKFPKAVKTVSVRGLELYGSMGLWKYWKKIYKGPKDGFQAILFLRVSDLAEQMTTGSTRDYLLNMLRPGGMLAVSGSCEGCELLSGCGKVDGGEIKKLRGANGGFPFSGGHYGLRAFKK